MADPASSSVPTDGPIYPRRLTFLQRLHAGLTIHLMKFGATQAVRLISIFGDKSILPTFTKVYPNHPALTHRVYIPRSYQSGEALPLYFHIHGGGFALMSPLADDKFCTTFANDNKILVISLDYPKSPEVQCPTPVLQVIDVVKAILADESLPFDKKKIAVGGFSAGANLSLAISQDEDLRLRIGGVVAFYPPVNWTTSLEYKLSTRPKDAPPDMLRNMCIPFDWAYLNPDQDLRDPQLSVAFAPRENLPRKICIFGCELDLLCREAEVMAENLSNTGSGQRVGTDIAWEKNGIKWEKVMGVEHGFDVSVSSFDKEKTLKYQKRGHEMHQAAAEWLYREVYV